MLLLVRVVLALTVASAGRASAAFFDDVADVVPILGTGHHFGPGPRGLGFQGLQVEPSTILDFDGTVALGYFLGRATDGTGKRWRVQTDMRVFRGSYRAADGMTRSGTFGFV